MNSQNSISLATRIFVFAFLGVYFVLLWVCSVNIPYTDDFDNGLLLAVLNLIQAMHAHHYKIFFLYLFEQHNEHRILTTRLVAFFQYLVFGQINFKWLMLIANLYKVGILFLLYFVTPKRNDLLLLLLILLIFQLSDWESSFWAMAALSNYAVIFFAFLSLFFLQKSLLKVNQQLYFFLLACIFSFLTVFSTGNGMVVFIPGCLMLVWHRDFGKFLFYFALALACGIFYMHGYVHPSVSPPLYFGPKIIIFCIKFLGAIGRNNFSLLAAMFGIGVCAYLVVKEKNLKRSLFFYFLLFILMSTLVTAVARSGFDMGKALQSRYSMYSVTFFAILLAWYVQQGRVIGKGIIFLVILIFVINVPHGIKDVLERSQTLKNYKLEANGLISGLDYCGSNANQIIKQAADMNVYHLPNLGGNNE